MQFESVLSSAQRKEVHRCADSLGLYHHSVGTSSDQHVVIQAAAPPKCHTATIGRSAIDALGARHTLWQRAPAIAVHVPSNAESEDTPPRVEPSAEQERERWRSPVEYAAPRETAAFGRRRPRSQVGVVRAATHRALRRRAAARRARRARRHCSAVHRVQPSARAAV